MNELDDEKINNNSKLAIIFEVVTIFIWSFLNYFSFSNKFCLYCICSNLFNELIKIFNRSPLKVILTIFIWIFGIWVIYKFFQLRKNKKFVIIFISLFILWLIYFLQGFSLSCSCFCL